MLEDELQGMLDHFSAAFDIRIGVFDSSGGELVCGLGRPACGFCRKVAFELKLSGRCRKCDMKGFDTAARTAKMTVYRCHAGLVEAIQPIFLEGGELAGFLMIGQFRTEDGAISKSVLDAAGRGNVASLRALFNKVPCVPQSRLPHVLGLFSMIVDLTVRRRMVSMKGELLLGRIEQAALARLDGNLSLSQAAKLVGRSPSTVSHLFKSRLGVSFKQRLLQLKLDAAERLLKESPAVTVAEVAAACGFSSPFHFSRLFKKRRGVPPSMLKKGRGLNP